MPDERKPNPIHHEIEKGIREQSWEKTQERLRVRTHLSTNIFADIVRLLRTIVSIGHGYPEDEKRRLLWKNLAKKDIEPRKSKPDKSKFLRNSEQIKKNKNQQKK